MLNTTPAQISIELKFTTIFEGVNYHVSFESDSPTRNRVNEITTSTNLPIDVVRLVKQNPKLWQHIKSAISNNANSHYNINSPQILQSCNH
jgi:hypothetical protein